MRRTPLLAAVAVTAVVGCLLVPAGSMAGTGHTFVLVGVLLAVAYLVAIAREARRHQQLASSIARLARPATLEGHAVGMVSGLEAAVVAGLRRPRIYCADDLPGRLDRDELRAVILHEHHHRLARAPARLVLIGALGPLLGRTEAGRAWLERERARIEISADDYALAAGASRAALASALVKLSGNGRPAWAPGFASAADLRVRALLGEATGIERDHSVAPVATGLLVVLACLALYLS